MISPSSAPPPTSRLIRFAAKARADKYAALAAAFLLSLAAHAADLEPHVLLLGGAFAGDAVIAVGETGTILRSSDNAHSWERVPAPTLATLTAVTFADAQHGWAVGHDALILASNDGGRSWTKQWQGENISDSCLDAFALDTQRVLVIGAYGLFLHTNDGGRTWTRQKISDEDYHFNHISRGPTGTLYLAGEHGTLLRSTDNGTKWTRMGAPYDGSFYGVLPLDKRTLIAHGLRGRIFKSTDDGATWEPLASPQPALLAAGLQLKSNFIVLAGQARTLLVSHDYAHTFASWDVSFDQAISALIELSDGSVLALGEAGATILPKP